MSYGEEREAELKRRKGRKKLTIKQLRQEMTKNDIGYMSNWTKPVLLKRLKEHDEILDKEFNQMDAMRSFEDQLEDCKREYEKLGVEMTSLAEQKNAVAIRRAELHSRMEKLKGVVELTKPSF